MKKLRAMNIIVLIFCLTISACQPSTTVVQQNAEISDEEDFHESIIVQELKAVTVEVDGRNSKIKMEVSASPVLINEVKILEHKETTGITDLALSEIPKRIVEEQSIKVDAVAGATITSNAIMSGTEKALLQMGYDLSQFDKTKKIELAEGITETTDLVIVGAGLSGLISGIELTKYHPEINFIILEQLPFIGGSLSMMDETMIDSDTKEYFEHKNQDIVPTIKDFIKQLEISSKTELNEESIKNIIKYLPDFKMDLRLNSKVTELITKNGEVMGVKVEDNEKEYDIMAKAVILATGGLGNNYSEDDEDFKDDEYDQDIKDGYKFVEQFGTKILGEGNELTILGIEINEDMQVLDKNKKTVPNLYASGELTVGNAFLNGYTDKETVIWYAFNSGRLVAMKAAEAIENKILD